MLDFKTEIVSNLSSILPIYYELDCDSTTPVPCITYMEYMNNEDARRGKAITFSNVGYTLKLWDRKISDLSTYANTVDKKMNELGFIRESSNELTAGNQICKIMKYYAYCDEHITNT